MTTDRDILAGIERRVEELLRTDAARARDLAQEALDAAARIGGAGPRARAHRALAHACHALGRYPEAVSAYETARAEFARAGRKDDVNRVSVALVDALMYVARFDDALELAATTRRKLRGPGNAILRGRLAWNEGNVHHRQDRYDAALRCYRRARPIFSTRPGGERAAAMLDLNRAVVLTVMNEPEKAHRLFSRCRRVFAGENLTALRLQADYNLSYLEFLRGRMTEALHLLDRLRPEFLAAGDRRHAALCDLDRSEILNRLNLFSEAGECAAAAAAAFGNLAMRLEAGKAHLNGAVARAKSGDRAAAAADLASAARLFDEEGSEVRATGARLCLAELLLLDGDHRRAREIASGARDVFAALDLGERAAWAEVVAGRAAAEAGDDQAAEAHLAAALAGTSGRPVAWIDYRAHRERAGIALRRGDRAAARDGLAKAAGILSSMREGIDERELRASFLADKHEVYVDLVSLLVADGETEDALAVVERSKGRGPAGRRLAADAPATVAGRAGRLSRDLGFLYHSAGEFEGRGDERSLRQAERLREDIVTTEDELARLIALYPEHDPQEDHRVAPASPDGVSVVSWFVAGERLLAFVRRGGELTLAESAMPTREVARIADRLSFQIGKFGLGAGYASAHGDQLFRATDALLGLLHDALIEPIREAIADDDLVIVPHGFLHAVPFHALRGPDGPLIEEREVTLRPTVARARRTGAGAPLLVGVPDEATPHVKTEIASIRRALRAGRTLLGSDATVAAFRRRAPRAGILHIATHGVFRDDNPSFSALMLADGWLGMGEIGGLGLRAGLVTLSACETGRAQVLTGDEVAGLAREFLAAGVPTLLASLWRVNDRSTADYMKSFYTDLRAGATPASAMRTAALAVRSRFGHPYHWAPFVVLGDGRSTVVDSPWEMGEVRRCGVHQE